MSGAAGKLAVQRDEGRVAMHQHGVKIARVCARAISRCRVGSSRITTMSRTEHGGSVAARPARAAAISGSSSKAKARRANGNPFDDDRIGLRLGKGGEQDRPPRRTQRIVERPPGFVDQFEARVMRAHRRQLHGSIDGSRQIDGGAAETSVTAMPSRAKASAICRARCRCPIPSSC